MFKVLVKKCIVNFKKFHVGAGKMVRRLFDRVLGALGQLGAGRGKCKELFASVAVVSQGHCSLFAIFVSHCCT